MPAKKKSRIIKGQSSLTSYITNDRDPATVTEAVDTEPLSVSEAQTVTRSFQERWRQTYRPWLIFTDHGTGMQCAVCIDAKRSNSFTVGCKNYRTSAINEHIKTNDHQTALIVPELQKNMQKANKKVETDQEKGVLVAMKAVYWLAKESLPLAKFKSLLQLFHDLDVPNVKFLKKSDGIDYSSSYSAQEFLSAISETLDKKLENDMKNSPVVAVLADESTDISVHKRLVIYVQLLNPVSMKTFTHYLTNVQICEGTGAAIAAEIFNQCKTRGVTCEKIMGLGSDGASVMTGRGKGVAGMMMRENPHIINVHCVAHRLALSTSQAAENVAALKEYQETITSIYYYFKYSPNKVASVSEIQKVLNDPQLRYKEVHSVRWLSFYNALETVYRTLDSLLTYFAGTINSKDAKAAGLKKKVGTAKFISMTYMLMDIIPIVGKLNLFFQKENVDVALVKVNLDHCLQQLENLKNVPGPYERQLETDLDLVAKRFKEHEISLSPHDNVQSVKVKFLSNLIRNMTERFPDTDLLTAFGVLSMRPVGLLTGQDLDDWGNEAISVLIRHFGEEKEHSWVDDERETHTTKSGPIIDGESTRREWSEIKQKVVAQMYPRDNICNLWQLINQYHSDECPNLIKLAQLALVCPVHTAGCERGFSVQNIVLTSLRNRLLPETQDMLLRVCIEGSDEMRNFDFAGALNAWRSHKKRSIFT